MDHQNGAPRRGAPFFFAGCARRPFGYHARTEWGNGHVRIGVLILSVATLAFLVWLGMSGGIARTGIHMDGRAGAYADSRRIIARIQSDLERTAAGHQAWPLPAGIAGDPLEAVVDAYRLFLDGNSKGMDARLKEIAANANARLGAIQGADTETGTRATAYFTKLAEAASSPAPATRMLTALRLVDGILFLEAAQWSEADPAARTAGLMPELDGTWLRLPCRTILGRQLALRDAQAALGPVAGPLLSCPSDNPDLAVLEAQAKAPAMLPTRTQTIPLRPAMPQPAMPQMEPSAPPTPWDAATAIAWMDEDPDAAEPVLASAATTPAGKLDYALFLHAFRPAGPDNQARIHALLRDLSATALAENDDVAREAIGAPLPYDGGDASLVPTLRLASSAELTGGAYYAIPCAVLQARPGLLEATEPLFGSNRDNFLPRSGCAWGRGAVHGFPAAAVDTYVEAATEADGHFLAAHQGSLVHALAAGQRAALERLKLDPRGLAAQEPPAMDHPYEVWGLTSPANRAVEQRIAALYRDAVGKLVPWYVRKGLAEEEAARAAKAGLFDVVWGARCGDAAPTPSLRGLLLDKAPIAEIREVLAGREREAPEVTRCAAHAGLDPLVHAAVVHPQALALLLERGAQADEPNSFGKTPLMAAAQANQIDSVRLLLDRSAAVNATTWQQDGPPLAHDGRNALMYAAANAALPVVKLLLERGADPHMADSKGSRAIDYLLGFGPVPANAVMSADERAEAARLLY